MRHRAARVVLAEALLCAACSGSNPEAASTTVAPTTSTRQTAPPSTATTATTTLASYVPDGVDPDSPCLARAVFGEPDESPYLLPFPPGAFFLVTQSYCFSEGGHRQQLSYDFSMPMGSPILSARSGVVVDIREDSPDTGRGNGEHNYVFIRHSDGTVGFYAHLMQDEVHVEIGDEVDQGQVIGLSGNSGLSSHPHLHFGVYSSWPPSEGHDEPITFRNAAGRTDPRGGLIEGLTYEAVE